ncbi:hypothetical protein N7474_000972 [Penicillium riverlandense]|uniref:uncharacterized protein n=1 Tax=Penicillium riverlandense TaxID=1903569 RepID=UPI0025475BF5|nr:uncharacterized protein N7474_000972 [Penicillium riverlandense]KAJ5832661.1 hypothetical protein N7474_000972 [Penicillium riverlandense]
MAPQDMFKRSRFDLFRGRKFQPVDQYWTPEEYEYVEHDLDRRLQYGSFKYDRELFISIICNEYALRVSGQRIEMLQKKMKALKKVSSIEVHQIQFAQLNTELEEVQKKYRLQEHRLYIAESMIPERPLKQNYDSLRRNPDCININTNVTCVRTTRTIPTITATAAMAAADMPLGFWILMSVIAGIIFVTLACLFLKLCLRPAYYAAAAGISPQTALTHEWLRKKQKGQAGRLSVLLEAEDPEKNRENFYLFPSTDVRLVPLPPGWSVPNPPPAWIRPPAAAAEGRREALKALAGLCGALVKKTVMGDDPK